MIDTAEFSSLMPVWMTGLLQGHRATKKAKTSAVVLSLSSRSIQIWFAVDRFEFCEILRSLEDMTVVHGRQNHFGDSTGEQQQ